MNTSTEAIRLLQEALTSSKKAVEVINDLVVGHDYQDVAELVAQAASALLESAALLMQSKDEAALDKIEAADELLDAVYTIIDSETDDE